jgi:hypothetical protein
MENVVGNVVPGAPNWTGRGTREALAIHLGGLIIRDPGWYEVPGGRIALVSNGRTEDTVETLRASMWDVDPRPGFVSMIDLPTHVALLHEQFISNWPKLVELSRKLMMDRAGRLATCGMTRDEVTQHETPQANP